MKIISKIKDYFSHKESPNWGFQLENIKATVFSNYHSLLSKLKTFGDMLAKADMTQLRMANDYLILERRIQELEKEFDKILKKPKTKSKP